jgi:hypothetical protein
VDIAFADRYSICVINADYYLAVENKSVAEDFFNDTLLTQQQACAFKLVVWTGEKESKAALESNFGQVFIAGFVIDRHLNPSQ